MAKPSTAPKSSPKSSAKASPAKRSSPAESTASRRSPRTTAAPQKAVVKKTAPAKKGPSLAAPTRRKSSGTTRARSQTPRARSTPAPIRRSRRFNSLERWLTLNRSLDIAGILSVFLGLLLFLSLLSTNNSAATGGMLAFFRRLLGGGIYVFPFALLAGGLWLILRNFERIPELTLPRFVGFSLLLLNLSGWLHFLAAASNANTLTLQELAEAGRGGGYLGSFLIRTLEGVLGVGGAAIALVAWLLVGLVLALDVSVLEIFNWIGSVVSRLQSRLFQPASEARRARLESPQTPLQRPSEALPYTPVQPRAGSSQAASPPFLPIRTDNQAVAQEIHWVLPNLDQILEPGVEIDHNDDVDRQRARLIEETLASFGAPVRVVEINRGPTITQFGVEPDFIESRSGKTRVRVSKITALSNDLALALSARSIRVEAPVPGKGYVGIEVPNEKIGVVALRDVLESEAIKRLKSPLRFALGQNVSGQAVAADLAAMPHLLIAGQTGSGKSVCVNALISCLLINNTPDDLRLIMVDPKRVELTGYNGIPHLLAPVVVELERVVAALQWVTREMDMRYRKLAEMGSRNIQDYNAKMIARGQARLPYLVVVIDELADLMMLAPDETERTITRLAQLARATGIHLVIATQRPSVDVVTGLIKANFPARVAFAVASNVDSRVILDQPGAETLLGRGDMLFQAPDSPAPVRLQGVYLSDAEIFQLVSYWQEFTGLIKPAPTALEAVIDGLPEGVPLKQMSFWDSGAEDKDQDPLMNEAIDLARRQGRASISMLQRRLRIGYSRAARIIESMEEKGIVGPPEPGSGAREILDYGQAAPPLDDN